MAGFTKNRLQRCVVRGIEVMVVAVCTLPLAAVLPYISINKVLISQAQAFTPNVPDNGIDTISNEVITDGDQYVNYGGTTINITIGNIGRQIVGSGGISLGSIVIDGGLQDVLSGGIAQNSIVKNSGVQFIKGGLATGAVIEQGGRQSISDNGIARDSQIYNGGKQVIYTDGLAENAIVYAGGLQEISSDGKAINTNIKDQGLQVVRLEGLVEQTVVDAGGIQFVYDGGTTKNTIINPSGLSVIHAGGKATGDTNNAGVLDLSNYNGSEIELSGIGGRVLVYDIFNTNQRAITMKSLTGEQTFTISADLANNKADKLSITGTSEGIHYIKVLRESTDGSDLGFISGKSATVVDTNNGNANFTGLVSAIDGVNIMPIITQDANKWDLTGYKIMGPSNLTLTDIAGANVAYAALLSGHNSLQQRLGELRDLNSSAGVWGRIYGGEYAIDDSKMKYRTIQGGWDIMRKTSSGRIVNGVFLEHLSADNTYNVGSGKTTNTLLGLYHAWMGKRGHYYDLVFKTGRLYNEITVRDTEAIKGSYKISNSTVSAEYGYRQQLGSGYYITPQLALNFSWLGGMNYTTNTGTVVREEPVNSVLGRIGTTIGRKIDNVEIYLAANLLHEFSAKTRVATGKSRMAYTMERDFRGDSLEIALGTIVNIGKKSLVYADSGRSFGGNIVNRWTVQAGYRYSW